MLLCPTPLCRGCVRASGQAKKKGEISPHPFCGMGSFPGLTPLALFPSFGSVLLSITRSVSLCILLSTAACAPTAPHTPNPQPRPRERRRGRWALSLLPREEFGFAALACIRRRLLELVAWAQPVPWKKRRDLGAGRGELAWGWGGGSGSRSPQTPQPASSREPPGCHLQPHAGPTPTPSSQEGFWGVGLPAPSFILGGVRTPTRSWERPGGGL